MATILVVFLFVPKFAFGAVVINEVLYDPTGSDDTGKEYIRLYNNDNSSFDLTGYQLNATSGDYYTFSAFSLGPKSFITVHWRKEGTNTQADLYTGTTGFDDNMGNTNGWVAFFKSNEQTKDSIMDYLEYGVGGKTWESIAVKAGIWTADIFITDVPAGKAIKLKTDGIDNNSPSDWTETKPSIIQEESEESTTEKPSVPLTGSNRPPIAEAGDNIIAFINQEIKFDGTKSTDPDNNELAYSWNMGDGKLIEKPTLTYVYNYPGTYTVSLMVYDGQYYVFDTAIIEIRAGQITINEFLPNPSGKDEEEEWIEIYNDSNSIVDISDWQLDDTASGSKSFVFPKNTLIAPKSYIVLTRQITGVALNNDKDSVRLLLPEGLVFQEINYENPPLGKSSAKTEEGFVWSESTPGTANITNLAVNEIKKFTYQQAIEPETVKESNQDYAWYYQNAPQKEIGGNYENIGAPTENLAAVKEVSPQKEPTNLVLILGLIVLGGFVIGFLLVKFRKKYHSPASFN